jgi:hypothetical protein
VAEGDRRFRFAQFEFPWALGPDDGRYVVRDAGAPEPSHVLVLRTLGAPERRRLGGRRPRSASPEPPPEPVSTARATVVDAQAVGEGEAAAWLGGMRGDVAASTLGDAIGLLNRVLAAQRLCAADPYLRDVSRDQALVARLGHGAGEQVAEGRWEAAIEVPADRRRRQRRAAALRPQERLAALLAGREAALACEELTLRARVDLDAGRSREAALQLRVALEAGLVELNDGRAAVAMEERLGELRDQRRAVGAAANQAVAGPLAPATLEAVEHALGRLEAALRARAAAGPPVGG